MNETVMERWNQIAGRKADDAGFAAPLRIVIAGGGTGGHLFPGIAIADEFMARDPGTAILFVSTGNPLELSILPKAGFKLETISVEGIKGRGLYRQFVSLLKIPGAVLASRRILGLFRPDLVVGVGSYSAGPVVIAAWLMGIKIVLHEQNILPGITNRLLAGLATKVFVSFEKMSGRFKPAKTVVTGNPVRKEILELVRHRTAKAPAGAKGEFFRILIIGGSQGAHSINLAVIASLPHLKDIGRYHFVHQAGPQDREQLETAYRRHGIANTVAPFFEDMQYQYETADLIICRAGATTIAELTAIGKGAIFVPFPFAADNHQLLNARSLSSQGAAETISQEDLDGPLLAERITFYAKNPAALEQMAARAKSLGKPDAARRVVAESYKLLGRA